MHQYFWEVCFYGKQIINFNLKGFCYSFAWSCSLCEGRTNFYMGLMSWKLWVFLLMFLTGFTSLSVLFLFPLSLTFLSLCTVFDAISSDMGEVLLINPSANVFVFGNFNLYRRDWLTYSGSTDRAGELYHNFSNSNNPTRMVNFLTWIPDCDCHSPALLDLFLLTLVFVLKWVSLQWEILTWSCFSFHWLSIKLKMGCPISLHSLWLFFWWFWWAS